MSEAKSIKQHFLARTARVRAVYWHPTCYLKIDIMPSGHRHHGPWLHLYDRPGCLATKQKIPLDMLCMTVDMDEPIYEAYTGPLDEADPDFTAPPVAASPAVSS